MLADRAHEGRADPAFVFVAVRVRACVLRSWSAETGGGAQLNAATNGLGYLLTDSRETGRADIVLALLGKVGDSGMRRIET